MKLKFTVTGEPHGKERPRFNHKTGHTYTPSKTVDYEATIVKEYRRQVGSVKFPDDAAIDLRVLAYYAIPASASKNKKVLMELGVIRPTKTPDWDNVGKAVSDGLNKIAYRDDAQIVDAQVRKFYALLPRVTVILQSAWIPQTDQEEIK
ncbi:MAG: RusA family crossover junction endodeoxyribonuclease [Oscillospiraceae bacterium]